MSNKMKSMTSLNLKATCISSDLHSVILLREISKAAGNICQAHDNVQSASTEISNSDLSMEAKEELFDREIRPKAVRQPL